MTLEIIIIGICLVANAFFSAFEMAFVAISPNRLTDLTSNHKKIGKKVQSFKEKPERTLSAIQVGISLVAAIAAAVGGSGAVERLEPYFIQRFDLSPRLAESLAVIAIILPLTYLTVVFGELLPKTIALRHPARVLVYGTNILSLFERILSPLVTLLEASTSLFLKVLRIDQASETGQSGEHSIHDLPAYHQKFVANLISLKGKRVRRAEIPKEKVITLQTSDSKEIVREKIRKAAHSRFPVLEGDRIKGLLHARIFNEVSDSAKDWMELTRPILSVQESDEILEVFRRMQHERQHLAAVINTTNEFVGIITIEDILEEIVGDIHDLDEDHILKLLSRGTKLRYFSGG
jgi:putative hemolysin